MAALAVGAATELRGRLVAAAFVIGALSVAGVPSAVGFLGKLELFRTAVTAGGVVLVVLLVLGSALSLLYMFQTYKRTFWRGGQPGGGTATALPGRLIVAALGVVVLGLGPWPEHLLVLSQRAADVLTGPRMIAALGRVVALVAVYLLVLTSVAPGASSSGPCSPLESWQPGTASAAPTRRRPAPQRCGGWSASPPSSAGRWWTWPAPPGRSRSAACGDGCRARAWSRSPRRFGGRLGVRVGLSPDTIVVEVDERHGALLLHVLDARDPDAVRREQLDSYERRQRRVVP